MQTLLQDLRYAVRQLWKSPGFTLAAVITFAIGIGANTAIFSSMDAVVLRPLAVPQMDRVVTVAEQKEEGQLYSVALANYADWQRQNKSFEEMAVHIPADMSLTGTGDAAHVGVTLASADFFTVLRAQPVIGRVFAARECVAGQDAVAVLNYGFWQRKFASDPGVLGRTIQLDQRDYTVIGVMPKALQYPSQADIFVPLAPTPAQLADRAKRDYLVLGRLGNGVTVRQAQSELRTIASHLAAAHPATNQAWTVRVEPLLDGINGEFTPRYYKLVMGATLFVLLVVCANVANLQFARGIARRPEIAMRSALGASRTRLVRQLLTENILLGLIGAIGGILFGAFYLHMTLVTMPERVARYMSGWSNISLNGRTLAFSILIAVIAGVVAGFAPAAQAMRLNLVDQLKAGSRTTAGSAGTRILKHIFAIAQISLAVALVIGAALISKGMRVMLHTADVYEPARMLTFKVQLPENRYDTPAKRAAWFNDSLAKLRQVPGVTHAEVAGALPYSDSAWMQDCSIENRPVMPGKFQSALRLPVSEGFLSSFRIGIVAGRAFTHADTLDSVPVAIVSRKFAAQYFPGENAIGHRIHMGDANSHEPWLTIVGIAEDAHYSLWFPELQPAVYMNVAQVAPSSITYAVTTDGQAAMVAPTVRKQLAGLDPALPLDVLMPYEQFLNESLLGLKYVAVMLVIDAAVALLLSAIGIFGVMANLVGERTREIGVRLAVGARREDVLAMILRRASVLTGIGLTLGVALAFGLAHLTAGLLFGVHPHDPVVFSSITVAIALIAMGSSWIPARRAARIEPMVALHDE
ncbi:MAG TPA: ABC transporter permease [Terracidiphilus sp.]|nr:ABC transporter permease [Terracidiphilus sp.]